MDDESYEVSIDIKPNHLFRYPSEWDPRQSGKTKGGYLEGSIKLPSNFLGSMRMIMTTVPDCCITQGLNEEILRRIPNIDDTNEV